MEEESNDHLSVLCVLCQDRLDEPVVLSCCGVTNCRPCLLKWLAGQRICPQCRVPVVAANSALRVSDSLEAALNLVGDLEARLAWAEGHIIELQAQEFAASSRATTSDGILH